MSPLSRSVAALATVLVLSGCVSLPRERGYTETRDLIAQQRPLPTDWSPLATGLPSRNWISSSFSL